MEILRDLGCHLGQGYHFARPLAPGELVPWWLRRTSEALPAAV